MEGAEVLELYELTYSDLILLSSPSNGDESTNNESIEEFERLETIRRRLMETLGPKGPGLLSITAVPKASLLRRKLLPLARKLALLDPEQRKPLLKEHKLGSDVPLKNPDRNVSSFAMQLKYDEALDSCIGTDRPSKNSNLAPIDVYNIEKFQDNVFGNLSETFKELGYCMMDMGLRVAQVCDKAIGGYVLEQSLLESGTAKGRLIHYHSALDSFVIRENGGRKGKNKYKEQPIRSDPSNVEGSDLVANEVRLCANRADLWQQWHYDYGIFTILTAPMFLASCDLSNDIRKGSLLCDQEWCYPNGCSYLQIFDPNKNSIFMVKTSPESFIIQVGESADILSKGKLRSKLHCVCRPRKLENLSRETFVMFLQPAWTKTFSISDRAVEQCILGDSLSHIENEHLDQGLNEFTSEILKLVPPLSSRLKDGMTFAVFSRETTKQYFGGNGLQSNK
ncbi:hypothetical protein K2173_018352 [Erythroxylum novogranatense]|uniref:Isopenicillin N synthase-like Fe(2+) 2OG dioxygenase domain-containing protein n=1 Tax=Erythroxylum novogranatense TaxID=1862640 RepID=A0AAV8UE46_9ROSI|nr:hypothetical protein K2173_018352 [Erythroxylum novogranatense]